MDSGTEFSLELRQSAFLSDINGFEIAQSHLYDKKELNMRLKQVPFLSLLISLSMLLAYFQATTQDEKQWQVISKIYQQTLIRIEAPIYLDFISRQLSIKGQDDEEELATLQSYLSAKDKLPLIKRALSDQKFLQYMKREGKVFLDLQTLSNWNEARETIQPYYQALSAQRFALKPDQFRLSKLFTHAFVTPAGWVFVLGILAFGLISALFEIRLGRFKLTFYLMLTSITSTIGFMALGSEDQQLYQGSLGFLYGLGLPLAFFHYLTSKHNKAKPSHEPLATVIVCLLLIVLCSFLNGIYLSLGIAHYCAYILSGLLSLLALHTALKIEAQDVPDLLSQTPKAQIWEYRAELAKALEFVSRFEFNSARQCLNALSNKYPDSRAILEQRYHLAKFQPDDERYWHHARRLIDLSVERQDYLRIKRLFADIQKNAASKQRAQDSLEPEHYHKMMMVFIHHNDLPKAEQTFLFLELGGDQHIICDACQLLIEEFRTRHIPVKQRQYEMLLERLKA